MLLLDVSPMVTKSFKQTKFRVENKGHTIPKWMTERDAK